jgi:hypothetical protein
LLASQAAGTIWMEEEGRGLESVVPICEGFSADNEGEAESWNELK